MRRAIQQYWNDSSRLTGKATKEDGVTYWYCKYERTSHTFPNPLAKGRVIKLGTKNTGSHFANRVALGFNTWYSPSFSLNVLIRIMEAKRAPHPARLDGNGIEYLRNKDRTCMSRRTRIVVARIVCLFPVDGGAADDDGVFVAVAERAWYLIKYCESIVNGFYKEARLATRASDREMFDKKASSSMVIIYYCCATYRS